MMTNQFLMKDWVEWVLLVNKMKRRNYKRELKKLVRNINVAELDDILVYVRTRIEQSYEYYSKNRDAIKYTDWIRLEKAKKKLEKINLPLYYPYDNYKDFSVKEPEKYQLYLEEKKGIVEAIQLLLLLLVHIG